MSDDRLVHLGGLLEETVDVLRDLLGALIDLQPPDTQSEIAELQVRMLQAVEIYRDATDE